MPVTLKPIEQISLSSLCGLTIKQNCIFSLILLCKRACVYVCMCVSIQLFIFAVLYVKLLTNLSLICIGESVSKIAHYEEHWSLHFFFLSVTS